MANALVTGLLTAGVPASCLRVSSPSGGGASRLSPLGISCSSRNEAAARGAHILVLAVKPWMIAPALASLLGEGAVGSDTLVVSIASGISVAQIESGLRPCVGGGGYTGPLRIARVMPNTPSTIGVGAAGMFMGRGTLPEDAERVRAMFGALGTVETVTELQLDAVTGLSGSGPAFVFMFIEALADGAVAAGLPRPIAMRLAAQLVKGSATLVQQSGSHPGALKDAVASPAGTTIAGILALETGGMRGAVMSAVIAASKRCEELRRDG